jgi:intracellular multiplication protein IcmE
LRAAKFSATELRNSIVGPGLSALQLKAAGFSAGELKLAGFSAEQLSDAGMQAMATALFENTTFTGAHIDTGTGTGAGIGTGVIPPSSTSPLRGTEGSSRHFGSSVRPRSAVATPMSDTTATRRSLGFSAAELKQADFTLAEIKAAGFGVRDLERSKEGNRKEKKDGRGKDGKDKKDGNEDCHPGKDERGVAGKAVFSGKEMKEAGYHPKDLLAAGYSGMELKAIGFSAQELLAVGVSWKALHNALFLPSELRLAFGLSTLELKQACGCTAQQLREDNWSVDLVMSAAMLREHFEVCVGRTKETAPPPRPLRDLGYGAAEIHALGYTYKELRPLFSPLNMKRAFGLSTTVSLLQ